MAALSQHALCDHFQLCAEFRTLTTLSHIVRTKDNFKVTIGSLV